MHRALPARRRLARSLAAVAALALVPTLAACGDDGGDAKAEETVTVTVDQDGNVIDDGGGEGDGGDEAAPPLTQEQVDTAVLQPENLGEDWTSEEDTDDDDDESPGCLGEIDALTEALPEVAEAEVTFDYGTAGLPSIESGVTAYDDEAALSETFDEVQAALTACTSVTGTDDEGVTYDLTLSADEEITLDQVDDQINLTASGTLSQDGQTVEIYLSSTMARVGANVGAVSTTDLEDRSADHELWATLGIERLVVVEAGEEPAAVPLPDPS